MTLALTRSAARSPERAAPRSALLRAEGVTVDFGSLRALDGVDLSVAPGEIVALAGENGAGKSTLVRCIAGDVVPTAGHILLGGRRLRSSPAAVARAGVAVVWQDLSLCDNLDVAANLLLGRERRLGLLSETRFHAAADELLERLGIPLPDTARLVAELSGGQRQMVAVARAMRDRPRLLVLDEPTAALGVNESAQVEELTVRLGAQGTTILLVSHDIEQMFRLADRVVVLRHGRVVGDVDPTTAHPDDVVALLNGQAVDVSARRQLSRLHGLTGRLASATPSSSLSLILSALAAALGTDEVCLHLLDDGKLRAAGALGLSPAAARRLRELPVGDAGGPIGQAAARREVVVDIDGRAGRPWVEQGAVTPVPRLRSCFAMPVPGPGGVRGVITVFRSTPGRPSPDEVELASLYAGYVASSVERDRLLAELTTRNRDLETIREVLEVLAGPVPLTDGLLVALEALRDGLRAEEVALFADDEGVATCRAMAGGGDPDDDGVRLVDVAGAVLDGRLDGPGATTTDDAGARGVRFSAPGGPMALVARWGPGLSQADRRSLLEDAARSLRLALEREESERAHQEATALRRSRSLHQQFLSRLSHELRTPLTAIHGYASSLMQPDVSWDPASEERFLSRISAESARLARLVDDLLDSSAIESGNLRIQSDWCDLHLVLDSARACLPLERAASVELRPVAPLPAVWADHDRLEQVFVNLMDNAVRHNPPGTHVWVTARQVDADVVEIVVADDGTGLPAPSRAGGPPPRSRTAGSGFGLSIARGIIEAHGGDLDLRRRPQGTSAVVRLPVERPGADAAVEGIAGGVAVDG